MYDSEEAKNLHKTEGKMRFRCCKESCPSNVVVVVLHFTLKNKQTLRHFFSIAVKLLKSADNQNLCVNGGTTVNLIWEGRTRNNITPYLQN